MKIFIYKVLVVAFIFVVVFEITIGSQIKVLNRMALILAGMKKIIKKIKWTEKPI